MNDAPINPTVAERANQLFEQQCDRNYARTDRMFALLMAVQFVSGIICALVISPQTWYGEKSLLHIHVWAALVIGSLLSSAPIAMAWARPGTFLTRCVISSSQVLWSALLIHLTGGRIETHFHIFGSLAFLAFYRDWRVFIPATLLVAVDHGVRGWLWPESVYGVALASPFRLLEHSAWVVFEDIFLIWMCVQSTREMRQIAGERALLEFTKAGVEDEVRSRTAELAEQATSLRREVSERKQAQAEREKLVQEIMEVSRRAGMAEIATGVLHNVGNVLNSVNTSASIISERVRSSKLPAVGRVAGLLNEHSGNLSKFLTEDDRGRRVPEYLTMLADTLRDEQELVANELESLGKNIEHIKSVVSTQQVYAGNSCVMEHVCLSEVLEDALRLSSASFERHGISIIRDYEKLPLVDIDRHKLMQILVNVLHNAKQAAGHPSVKVRQVTVRIRVKDDRVRIEVIDSGIGIEKENLTRIFAHGFTSKKDGHGFGLHASALAAKEMGGSLTAHSEGPGTGAAFMLEVQARPMEVVA